MPRRHRLRPAAPNTAEPAKNPTPTQTPATAAEQGVRGDVYYYFTLGHLDEQQYELTGRADLATQAIESYKKALELAPDSPVIKERLAEIYAKSQHLREAVEQAQGALKLDPNNVDAHRLLARIYVRDAWRFERRRRAKRKRWKKPSRNSRQF